MQKLNLIALTTFSGVEHSITDISSAEMFCKSIAVGHYENFPVASVLLPKAQRQDIYNIYAFARTSDDIADTLLHLNTSERILLLDDYLNNLRLYCKTAKSESDFNSKFTNPILLALSGTINKLKLPIEPFERLIKAFQMDSDFTHAESWDDLLNYCKHSANPIGELVLRVFGLYNERSGYLSDNICTALQLANFWQDFSEDLPNGRCFIPKEVLDKYNLSATNYAEWQNSKEFDKCLSDIYDFTENFFDIGKELLKLLKPKRLKMEINATWLGGRLILKKTKALGASILTQRPKIRKSEMMSLFIKIVFS